MHLVYVITIYDCIHLKYYYDNKVLGTNFIKSIISQILLPPRKVYVWLFLRSNFVNYDQPIQKCSNTGYIKLLYFETIFENESSDANLIPYIFLLFYKVG
jgi:hypothetical protein